MAAATLQRASVAGSHGAGPPVASAVSRTPAQRSTRSTMAIDPAGSPPTTTAPSSDTRRLISSTSASEAPASRQRQASISRNNLANATTNPVGPVSRRCMPSRACKANFTSRSSSPPAEPPARRVRASQASPQVAASHTSHRSRGDPLAAASSRHSPSRPSTNAMPRTCRDPCATSLASRRSRRRLSSDSLTSASSRIRSAATRALTRGGRLPAAARVDAAALPPGGASLRSVAGTSRPADRPPFVPGWLAVSARFRRVLSFFVAGMARFRGKDDASLVGGPSGRYRTGCFSNLHGADSCARFAA